MEFHKSHVLLLLSIFGFLQMQYYVLAESQENSLFLDYDENEELDPLFGDIYGDDVCKEPEIPAHGTMRCGRLKKAPNMFTCKAKCHGGYEFSKNLTKGKLICDLNKSQWYPRNQFPSCKKKNMCALPCVNGGTCQENKVCTCPPRYRGIACEIDKCKKPAAPEYGEIKCINSTRYENMYECEAHCNPGFQFSNSKEQESFSCNLETGEWTPKLETISTTCQRKCNPACQNGGACSEGNKCVCTFPFIGDRCQTESCPKPMDPENGKISCSKLLSKNWYECIAECNTGYQFPSGEKKIKYECDFDTAIWSPSQKVPDCNPIHTSNCETGWTEYFNTDNPEQSVLGDDESMKRIRERHEFCDGGTITHVECRALKNGKMVDYKHFYQAGLKCSAENGFQCNKHIRRRDCEDFAVRFYCECDEEPLDPVKTCPELPESVKSSCPSICPKGFSCDGTSCIEDDLCPCFKDGIPFKPGSEVTTTDCQSCTCSSGGKSVCNLKKCKDCPPDQKAEMDLNCNCHCVSCPEGTTLCPTDGQCIAKRLWCDGVQDCADDEKDCLHTNPSNCSTDYLPDTNACELLGKTIRTFDGRSYQYETCNHILMKKHKSDQFSVSVHKICPAKSFESCYRQLEINVDGMKIRLGPSINNITFKSNQISSDNLGLIKKNYPEYEIKNVGNFLIFKSLKYNFDVIWNKDEAIKLVVSNCLRDKNIVGLCGLYNGDSMDDFMKSDGRTALASKDFGDSWAIGSLTNCKPHTHPTTFTTVTNKTCSKLYEDPFSSSCSQYVNMEDRVDACIESMLECLKKSDKTAASTINGKTLSASEINKCKCEAYESFAEACAIAKNGTFEEWRIKHDCSPICSDGMVWKDCGPGCQLTCDNYRQQSELCGSKCVPGCYCPSGLVRHKNQCVKPKMCLDCVCSGFGDPNYITFDERYYSFQGNCSYILAQHQISEDTDSNFKVLATNIECPEEPLTSCIDKLSIHWNGHVIEKQRNKPVFVGQTPLKPEDFPYDKDGISITYEPNENTIVHIQAINLVVRYFDPMYGYTVELPSFFYYNKTEGLCGICNFIKSDDLYHRKGYITADIEDFAYSWLEGPETRKNCEFTRVERPDPPPPDLCNFKNNSCADILDPSNYALSCQNDIKYSVTPEKSMCRSKSQYAQACCAKGVSLAGWLEQNGCKSPCTSGMDYECTSGCPKTCENYKTYGSDKCTKTSLLSCVCPEGGVLKSGKCVSESKCETCDSKGHVVGDEWQEGPCKTCVCRSDLSTKCVETECPEPPICDSKQKLKKLPRKEGSCCESYSCVLKTDDGCEEPELQVCPPGKQNVEDRTGKCPIYRCQCFPELCPPIVRPTLEEGENYTQETRDCCPEVKIICNSKYCPRPPTCEPGFKLSSQEGRCCSKFACVPQENVCVYQHKYKIEDGFEQALSPEEFYDKEYTPGKSWKDGLCRQCTCIETSGYLGYNCEVETCQTTNSFPSEDKYVWKEVAIPGTCCPKYKKTHCLDDGVEYNIGQKWELSGGSDCKIVKTCVADKNGDAAIKRIIHCEKPCLRR